MKKKEKTIFFIGAGKESLPGVHYAKKIGLKTVISDKSKNPPARKFSDHFIHSSTYDHEGTYKKINKKLKRKINGVMSLCADVPLTVSFLAKKLNLTGYSFKSATILSDKYQMKKFFKENNINTANFFLIKTFSDLKKKLPYFKMAILKPVDSRGSRGVFLIKKNTKNLKKLFKISLSHSKKKELIIENFITGQQLSTETIIYNKKAYTVGICDRNYNKIKTLTPHVIENGGDLPSRFQNSYENKINILILKIAEKLKIYNGTIKGDLVIHRNKIFVIEVAGRLSGGYFSSYMIPESSGINLIGIAMKLSFGEKLNKKIFITKKNFFVSQRYFFLKKTGIIKNIKVPTWIKESKNIIFFDLNIKVGSRIKKVTNHTDRIGQVIVKSKSKKNSIRLANKVCRNVKFRL